MKTPAIVEFPWPIYILVKVYIAWRKYLEFRKIVYYCNAIQKKLKYADCSLDTLSFVQVRRSAGKQKENNDENE